MEGEKENIFFYLIPYNQYRTILWEKIIKIRNKQKILKTKNNKKVILERNIVKNKNKVLSTARNSICVFSFNTSMKRYRTNEIIKFSKIRNQTNNNHNSKHKEKIKNLRNKSFLERFLFNGV
jgi:hypothetical protein